MTEIDVIIAWRDRPELLETIQQNAKYFAALDIKVTVVNCGGDVTSIPWSDIGDLGMPLQRIDIDQAEFNKGLALNHGVNRSDADNVLLLDADILLVDQTLHTMLSALTNESFVTVASVIDENRNRPARIPNLEIEKVTHSVEFVLPNGRKHRINTNTLNLAEGSRAGPGLILLRRADFLAVGGMKSTLTGWGWDDIDLIARLQIALGLGRLEVGLVKHLPHSPSPQSTVQGISEAQNYKICLSDYAIGDFHGTLERDIHAQNSTLHSL